MPPTTRCMETSLVGSGFRAFEAGLLQGPSLIDSVNQNPAWLLSPLLFFAFLCLLRWLASAGVAATFEHRCVPGNAQATPADPSQASCRLAGGEDSDSGRRRILSGADHAVV